MPEAALAAGNVNITYGAGVAAVPALRDVSVSFAPGRIVLVMGPSGSGKTTLLSVLGCMLLPDRGDVQVLGQSVRALSERERIDLRRQRIGYVFQAFRLFRSLTAVENLELGFKLWRWCLIARAWGARRRRRKRWRDLPRWVSPTSVG